MDITGFMLEFNDLLNKYNMQGAANIRRIDATKYIIEALPSFKIISFKNGEFVICNESNYLQFEILGVWKKVEAGDEPRIINITFTYNEKDVEIIYNRDVIQEKLIEIL